MYIKSLFEIIHVKENLKAAVADYSEMVAETNMKT